MKKKIKEIALIIPATGGILLNKITPLRIFLLSLIVSFYFLFEWLQNNLALDTTIKLFFTIFTLRYIFLFGSFVKNGFADQIKNKFGEKYGFEIYRIITAIFFFLSASSFGLMVSKSPYVLPFYDNYVFLFIFIGVGLAVFGFVINIWSTLVVGIDIYYYKDLFYGRKVGEFKSEGPYNVFTNPMYGPAQSAGYGTALIEGSIFGLTGIFLNQFLMYIFFFTIEKSHINKILLNK